MLRQINDLMKEFNDKQLLHSIQQSSYELGYEQRENAIRNQTNDFKNYSIEKYFEKQIVFNIQKKYILNLYSNIPYLTK